MNRQAYEEERLRGVHLSIILVLTVVVAGVVLSGLSLHWEEIWILPFLCAAVLVCWMMHIRQMFASETRLLYYAGVSVAVILLDGVQPTSIFDFAIAVAMTMTLFSQANNKRVLHLILAVYVFLLLHHIVLLRTGKGTAVTGVVIAELVIHTLIILVVHRIAVDIVQRRIMEAESDAREIRDLKDIQKRTEDFLTNVSHELRTPINAVTGIGSVMVRDAKTEEWKTKALRIFSAGRRLSARVEDMLDFTEIDTGKIVIAEETYAVTSLINDVVAECGLPDRESAAGITIEVEEGIPDRLLGGGRWIKKVLLHMTESAVQIADGSEVRVSVYARTRDYGINLCADVWQKGTVISGKMLERLREDVTFAEEEGERKVSTFDLGMRIIYGLVHAMGGFVRLSSGAEQGTHIHISIPQRIAQGKDGMQGQRTEKTVIEVRHNDVLSHAGQETQAPVMAAGVRALVVDDEPMNLIVAEGILTEYGMETDTAQSGMESIEKVRHNRYDVVFMDHMMPVMDGVEAAHRIREVLAAQKREVYIVALTANAVSGAREMFFREGFDGFVAKPIVREELSHTLKALSLNANTGAEERIQDT